MREAIVTVREQPFADVCQSLPRLPVNPATDRVLDVGPRVPARCAGPNSAKPY
jgi:hypothetical protein